jgi:hypothetical protein
MISKDFSSENMAAAKDNVSKHSDVVFASYIIVISQSLSTYILLLHDDRNNNTVSSSHGHDRVC